MSKFWKLLLAAGLALGLAVSISGTASAASGSGQATVVPADSAPGCSSVSQIGTTAQLVVSGQTFASVKQYVGCNKNYAYIYVWQSWRDSHSSWDDCTSIVVGSTFEDANCGHNAIEVWSFGANTVSQCTEAEGSYGPDVFDVPRATTNTVC